MQTSVDNLFDHRAVVGQLVCLQGCHRELHPPQEKRGWRSERQERLECTQLHLGEGEEGVGS